MTCKKNLDLGPEIVFLGLVSVPLPEPTRGSEL